MNNSNLSTTSGLSSDLLDKGDTAVGYSVIKVGLMSLHSTILSKISN